MQTQKLKRKSFKKDIDDVIKKEGKTNNKNGIDYGYSLL